MSLSYYFHFQSLVCCICAQRYFLLMHVLFPYVRCCHHFVVFVAVVVDDDIAASSSRSTICLKNEEKKHGVILSEIFVLKHAFNSL